MEMLVIVILSVLFAIKINQIDKTVLRIQDELKKTKSDVVEEV